jgi:S-DNA-T family DNA segregation ATPase FtsK/SpoIIIE
MRFSARPFPGSGSVNSGEAASATEPRRGETPDNSTDKRMPRGNPVVPRVAPRAKEPELPEPSLLANPVPSWLQPFTMPSNRSTRFTRTPDYLLRPREEKPAAPMESTPEWVVESGSENPESALIPGLDPGIQPDRLHPEDEAWMAGSSPAMRGEGVASSAGTETPAAPDFGPSQPRSVRRIASLIRLDWDQPPAVEQDPIGAEPEQPTAPETPDFSAGFEVSFSWPAFATATLAVTPGAPVIAPAPQPAPAPTAEAMPIEAAPVAAEPAPVVVPLASARPAGRYWRASPSPRVPRHLRSTPRNRRRLPLPRPSPFPASTNSRRSSCWPSRSAASRTTSSPPTCSTAIR